MNGTTAYWLQSAASLVAGAAIGWLYFHSLRLTVERLQRSRRPGTLVLVSFVVRAAAAVALFALIARLAQGHGLVAALLGFLAVRVAVVRRARREVPIGPRPGRSR